jgi:hypothetical protein
MSWFKNVAILFSLLYKKQTGFSQIESLDWELELCIR